MTADITSRSHPDAEAFAAEWLDDRIPTLTLARRHRCSLAALRRRAAEAGLAPIRGEPPRPRRGPKADHVGYPCPGLALCHERSTLVARLWAQTQGEIDALVARTAAAPDPKTDHARAISQLVGTLQKLVALDRATRPQASREKAAHGSFTDPYAADLADHRRSRLVEGGGLSSAARAPDAAGSGGAGA